MGPSRWTHRDTILLVDCLERQKRDDDWTLLERHNVIEGVQEELEKSGRPMKTTKEISARISTLGRSWTMQCHRDSHALYHHGWAALSDRCSREVLIMDLEGTYKPKSSMITSETSFEQQPHRNRRKYRADSGKGQKSISFQNLTDHMLMQH